MPISSSMSSTVRRPTRAVQVEAVRTVLDEIGAGDQPELLVVNKLDAAAPDAGDFGAGEGAVAVSARTGEGLEKLVDAITERLRSLGAVVEFLVPYDRGDVLAALHRDGEVLIEVHADVGTRVHGARRRRRPRPLPSVRHRLTTTSRRYPAHDARATWQPASCRRRTPTIGSAHSASSVTACPAG